MLAAELPFAVTPAAIRDDCGKARIGAAGVNCDRATEARTDRADAVRIDRGMGGKKVERIAEVLDLFETDDATELAFALAAAAHIETQRDITEFAQHARRRQHVRTFRIRAEAVQN